MTEKSKLRRSLDRWVGGDNPDDREVRHDPADAPDIAIGDVPDRQPVTVHGVLRSVTLRPRGGVPALEAELDDGTGVLIVIWLGRRQIAGIAPGRSMRVHGRVGGSDTGRTMYNPRYELMP